MRAISLVAFAFLANGCGDEGTLSIIGPSSRTVHTRVGYRVNVELATVGPGQFASPPAISTDVVRFLDLTYLGPPNPGSQTQRFSFVAEKSGLAVVRFVAEFGDQVVEDTIIVH
jgi:hypothetical protein